MPNRCETTTVTTGSIIVLNIFSMGEIAWYIWKMLNVYYTPSCYIIRLDFGLIYYENDYVSLTKMSICKQNVSYIAS